MRKNLGTNPAARRESRRGRIFWSACLLCVVLPCSVLGQVDAARDQRTRAYPVAPGQLDEASRKLQQAYRNDPFVRIQADPRTSRLLISAPAEVQAAIAAQLAPPPPPTEVPPYTLRNLTFPQLKSYLQRFWPRRVAFSPGRDGSTFVLAVTPGGNQPVLVLDERNGQVRPMGTVQEQRAWIKLLLALDREGNDADRWADFVPTANADPRKIQQAVRTLGRNRLVNLADDTAVVRTVGDVLPLIFGQLPGAGGQGGAGAQPPDDAGAGQPDDGQAGQDLPPDPDQPPIEADVTDLQGVFSSVQIQYIEGLGGFIIRGRRQDVERVIKLINDIKEVAIRTQPRVEVHYLQQANSEAVAELINEIYEQILLPRQGPVSITPLVKPNALLLIGSQENLVIVKETIEKLDTAVPDAMQFEVFPLKHVAAQDVVDLITTSFQEPTGLSTRVRASAIYHTNSVLVQASPRDMTEVRRMIEKVDDDDDIESTARVRIVRLYNATAEELAPIVQDALNWQLTGNQVPPSATGQGGAGVGQGTAGERARLRSQVIEFLQGDGETSQLLKSGVLTNVRITPDASSNSLVVTAPADSMDLVVALIEELDSLPTASAQIKVFTIENGDAARLAAMLQSMFGQTQQGGGGGAFGGGQVGAGGLQALGLQTAAAAGESSLAPLSFGVDERSNSIIVSGSEGDLTVIQALLLRLDQADVGGRRTVVYRLSNAPAQLVADSLTLLLNNQRQNLTQQIQQFGLMSAIEQVDREVFVVAEQINNSLIINATPRYLEEILQVVSDLDRRPPMIKIDILIAEIVLSDNEEFGVELGLQDSLLFDRGTVIDGMLSPGFLFNNQQLGNSDSATSLLTRETLAGQALSSFNLGRTSSNLNYGGLVLSAANESISILLRALQDSGRMQVLSRPQIQTLDSQPASILVGQRVPRITDTTLTNQGTTNSVVLDEVGLVLGVTPRVTADNIVVMDVDVTESQVGPVSDGIPISISANGNVINSPKYDVREAQTTISARNGQTIAFAGLIQTERSIDERKVPYIGDIPLVGHLFRFDNHVEVRRELLIIMTPHIVATQQDVDWVNYTETERMSWCLADVVELYREDSMFGSAGAFGDESAPVIFPATDPTGEAAAGGPGQAPRRVIPPSADGGIQDVPSPPTRQSSRRQSGPEIAEPDNRAAFYRPPAPISPAEREAQLIPSRFQEQDAQRIQFQGPDPSVYPARYAPHGEAPSDGGRNASWNPSQPNYR